MPVPHACGVAVILLAQDVQDDAHLPFGVNDARLLLG